MSDQLLTHRPCSTGLEPLINKEFKLLDHGFLTVRDYMGTDESIVNAARLSYQQGTRKVNLDQGLINYLLSHDHGTPFEMCDIKFHIKMPIFVARQWVRHRISSLNEMSARYSILDNEFYVPEASDISVQSTQNRQGRADEELSPEYTAKVQELLKEDALRCYKTYEDLLNDPSDENENYDPAKESLSRELARMNLTINTYTQWVWKCNLRSLMNFMQLRSDSHAQHEIRVYSDVMLYEIVQNWVPMAFSAFMEYQFNSVKFSAKEQRLLVNVNINTLHRLDWAEIQSLGFSKREYTTFKSKVDRMLVNQDSALINRLHDVSN